jgi:hypothetical protein
MLFKANTSHAMSNKVLKNRNQRCKRRMESLRNKARELGKVCDVNVSLIIRICKNGHYITYNLRNVKSWPPLKEEITVNSL